MIDERSWKELSKLHPKKARPIHCSFKDDLAVVHSTCMILELPKASVKIEETDEEMPTLMATWRDRVPKADPVQVQATRDRPWPEEKTEDGETLEAVCLIGGDVDQYMQVGVYEFIRDQLMDVQFRVYPGTREDGAPNPIAVYTNDKLVGLVGALVQKADPKWL
jgi:hypothetical protein